MISLQPPAHPLADEAAAYLEVLAREREGEAEVAPVRRAAEIGREIAARGTYRQSSAELSWGARLAWRNSTRCVGRAYWRSLSVRDCRDLTTAEEVFAALLEHLRRSTNGGRIRPLTTVFAPQEPGRQAPVRIWNEQLIRYAGYRRPDGSVIGDPRQQELTAVLRQLGWEGGAGTRFDLLPLAIQIGSAPPRLFRLPPEAVLEVAISHPDLEWFAGLGLKWHALPAISNMLLEIGGIRYPAAPFSGWYMGTEVAARNFADEERYNLLPAIARGLGLDTRREDRLWRDRALLELNVAVLHSFAQAGVKMVDHHTVTRHFVEFENREASQGRPTYADWSWIVPPLSGATTPVYHRHYEDVEIKPNFFYQPSPWRESPRPAQAPKAAGAATRCPFAHG